MATTSKDNEVLIAPPETATQASAKPAPRFDETATGSRPQPVALEIPVTVNGARAVEGTDKREPFSETTKTVLVFGNGAVIRLGSPVAAGQLLFLTNEKTKKEVVCQVVKSKNYKNVSGYVELEFTEPVVGFWGMRFPSDRIGTAAPASAPTTTVPPAVKSVSPVVSSAPKILDVKPAQIPSPQIHAEVKPAPQPRPAEVLTAQPQVSVPPPKPQTVPVQNAVVVAAPIAKQPDVPAISAPPSASSLASSLASLLSAPELPPAVAPAKPPTASLSSESKVQPASVPTQGSTEDLKLQAARLQEQLSSLLFSAAPTANSIPPAPVTPSLDPKTVSSVAAKVLEIAKPETAPVRTVSPAKTLPAPIKSSLDTEEVKIPSWLEPLARNAAASAPVPESAEREKTKHSSEITEVLQQSVKPLSLTSVENIPESALPAVGSLLPLDEPVITHEHSSGGSNRGVLYGAIAAGVLLVAGGAWYLSRPANPAHGAAVSSTSSPISAASPTTPPISVAQSSAPVSLPAAQNSTAAPGSNYASNSTPASSAPASNATPTKSLMTPQPIPATRDNTRGAGTPIPAAATERISRPPRNLSQKRQPSAKSIWPVQR